MILGIRVDRIRTLTFAFAGLLAAIAGLLMVARLGTSQPGIGESWPLNSIAGSVIGGVSLRLSNEHFRVTYTPYPSPVPGV